MKRTAFAYGLLVLAATTTARASILQVEEVIASVEARFPSVVAAREDRAIAEGEVLSALGAFDPLWRTRLGGVPVGYYKNLRLDTWVEFPTPLWGLTAFTGYRLTYGEVASYDGKLSTGSEGELRAGFQLPLWRNGPIDRRRVQVRRTELSRTVADASVRQQRIESLRLAQGRYWEWVAAGQRLAIARAILQIAIDRDAGLKTRVEHGDLPNFERTDNLRAIVQRQSQVVVAERAVEQAAIALSLYLRDAHGGIVRPTEDRLPIDLPLPKVPGALEIDEARLRALERRPELSRLDAQRAQQRLEIRLAKNQVSPQLDAVVAGSYDFGVRPSSLSKPELEAGLVVEVPFAFRAARGRVRVVEAEARKLDQQWLLARDGISNEVFDSVSAMAAASRRVEIAEREIELTAELEQAERKKFDLGDSTLLFVNIREQASAEARQRAVDARLDAQRAKVAFDAATAAW